MSNLTFHRPDLYERVDDIHRRLHTPKRRPACVIGPVASLLADRLGHDSMDGNQAIRLLSTDTPRIDSFNPLDVIGLLPQYDPAIVLRKIFEPIMHRQYIATDGPAIEYAPNFDVFNALAAELLAAVMEYEIGVSGVASSLIRSVNRFFTDDVVYNFAVLLDTHGKVMPSNCDAIVRSFLQCADRERALIIALINEALAGMNRLSVQRAIDNTSFDLQAVRSGEATVFVEVPAQLASCYKQVVRVWLAAILQLVTGAVDEAQPPQLLIVDNAAGLELLPQLIEALGYSERQIEVWSYWDNLSQIQVGGSARCSEYLGRQRRIDLLGPQNPWAVRKLGEMFGKPVSEFTAICVGTRQILWEAEPESREAAVTTPTGASDRDRLGNAITFTSARTDKWAETSNAILGRRDQTVVVVETAGRCHELSAEGRAQFGPVVRLDPFGILPHPTDTFDPLVVLLSEEIATDAYEVAKLIMQSGAYSLDSFWQNSATSLLRAVIQYAECDLNKHLSLYGLWKIFHNDDVKHDLAVVLDTIGKNIPPDAYQDISKFLQLSDNLQIRILAHVRSALIPFAFAPIQHLLGQTSFDLRTVCNDPATVYIEMPSYCSLANGQVIRIVLSTLIKMLSCAHAERHPPALFVIDHSSATGLLSPLIDAGRLQDGQVGVWSFWETLGQIQAAGPLRSSEYLSSLQRLEVLGPQDPMTARELAEEFGGTVAELLTLLPASRRVVWCSTAEGAVADRPELAAMPQCELTEHVVTIGRRRADKWREVSARIKHRSDGLVAVFETSGTCHEQTAQARESHGRVIRLDPSDILGQPSDHFNPFDLLKCCRGRETQVAVELTEFLISRDFPSIDPFWRLSAVSLIHGIAELLHYLPERDCTLEEIRHVLQDEDIAKQIVDEAEAYKNPLKDTGLRLVRRTLEEPDITRESIIAVAYSALSGAGNPVLSACSNDTTFPLEILASAEPVTIYVEVQPQRTAWEMILAKCWLKAVLELTMLHKQHVSPIIIVDSPIAHEAFPLLAQYQRSNQLGMWTFFNDAQVMQQNFPVDWPAFLMNTSRIISS